MSHEKEFSEGSPPPYVEVEMGPMQQPYQPPQPMMAPPPQVVMLAVAPFGPQPMQMQCPHCRASVTTATEHKAGSHAWLIFTLMCCFGCWLGCCLIPFCVESMQDVEHYCPNCKVLIGRYRR